MNNLRLFLLGLWLGAAVLFSAVVAPTSFRVLRGFNLPNAGEIAGTIVSHTLSVVNLSGFVLSLILMAIAFGLRRNYSGGLTAQLALLAVMAITTGAGEWIIAARMRALRAAMIVPIDQVSLTDPKRVAFATLHGYSVAALGVAIIAALLVCFLLRNRSRTLHEWERSGGGNYRTS
ncbi:MAG TPA: DUF4149 domain-containing protein [Pyrinomonadaceae bacterium]|jgi:hypothetical protein|nr:DUF4149 domain-containing protein [Pyrinomonadaceae bacterium]